MGHKDTRMIEKHYRHLIHGWAGQEIDRKAPRLDLDLAAFSRPASREPKPVIELDPRLKNKVKAGLLTRDEGVSYGNNLDASMGFEGVSREETESRQRVLQGLRPGVCSV